MPIDRPDSAVAVFAAPAVDTPTLLRVHVTVTDGVQTVERDVIARVKDPAPSPVVGALAPLSVGGGHVVSLHAPQASGSVHLVDHGFYDYAAAQAGGSPSIALTPVGNGAEARVSQWTFTAPTPAPGAADLLLRFEITVGDRVGTRARVTQDMTIEEPAPRLIRAARSRRMRAARPPV